MVNIDKACENFKEYLEKADDDGLAEESLVETVEYAQGLLTSNIMSIVKKLETFEVPKDEIDLISKLILDVFEITNDATIVNFIRHMIYGGGDEDDD